MTDAVTFFVFNRWVLCMWTTAQMWRAVDLVFYRVMAVAQKGGGELIRPLSLNSSFCVSVTFIIVNKSLFLFLLSVCIYEQDAGCWKQ